MKARGGRYLREGVQSIGRYEAALGRVLYLLLDILEKGLIKVNLPLYSISFIDLGSDMRDIRLEL